MKFNERQFTLNFDSGHHLTVYKNGFTLWDSRHNRWVIDASCLGSQDSFTVADLRKGDNCKKIDLPASYPRLKRKKTK